MNRSIVKALIICGILAPVIYIATDILAGMAYPGYDFFSQAISELSAIGAPTRPVWIALTFIFNPLLVAFGIGIYMTNTTKRSFRITGSLVTVWGLLGFVWLFFPMNMRGAIGSSTDTMHLIMAAITVLLMMFFMGSGAATHGRRFRIFSILMILTMLFFGALTGQQAPNVAANLPTPWMGVTERISVYSPMLWIFALAIVILNSLKIKK